MCIFHVTSHTTSFKDFLEKNPELPVYQSHEKGEIPKVGQEGEVYPDYGFSCDVSDRAWSDVEGQIVDIISFLEVYAPHLQLLRDTHKIDDWRFDLPYECRLDGTIFTQCDYIPPKLMRLAGALEIGIEMSLYWASIGEEQEESEGTDGMADADSDV